MGVRCLVPHGVHDDCVMALAVHHHVVHAHRVDWAALMTRPSEARIADLVREEIERQETYLQEALAKSRMTTADLEGDREWVPLRTLPRTVEGGV